jgi:RHS repeat-associated protein
MDRVERDSDELVATYYYDPFGRRLWKEVNGKRTYFLYSDAGLVGEYDAEGKEIKTYGYRPGSPWTTDPLFMKVAGKHYFYLNDHLGTPIGLCQEAANCTYLIRLPFGEESDGSARQYAIMLPGQILDSETSLYYNWNRYFHPKLGVYITPDPDRKNKSINLYNYAVNNPLRFFDSTGLKTEIVLYNIGGGAIVSGDFGIATAKSDCINGRYYEARYWVIGIGLIAGLKVPGDLGKAMQISGDTIRNLSTIRGAQKFTIEDNYPPGYISFLDIEGHSASLLYTFTLADIEVGPYAGGRKDVSAGSGQYTGDIGAQLFKFEGVHLIRKGLPKEKCCDIKK